MGTPFDILGGRGADGGGVRLDGSARGLAVVLAAWGLLGVRQSWLRLAQSGGWFPKNVARNFHVNLSNFELASLELQRFQALLNVQAIELRATFRGVSGLVLVALRFPNDVMVPNSVMVPQKCRT